MIWFGFLAGSLEGRVAGRMRWMGDLGVGFRAEKGGGLNHIYEKSRLLG